MWVKLYGLFTNNKLQRRVFLQQEFFDCHQDDQSIDDYYRRLKTLADELRDISAKVDDDLLLSMLTAGLNEDFGNTAFIQGGGDTITAVGTSRANLFGDVRSQGVHSHINGGDDTISGSEEGEKIIGDVGEIASSTGQSLTGGNDAPFAALLREYDRHHALVGRTVTVRAANEPVLRGVCQGLDETGRLLLRDGKTIHRVIAGHVESA